MLITIILVVVFIAGLLLCFTDSEGLSVLGICLVTLFGILLIIHCIAFATKGYDYREIDARRTAYIETLKGFREKADPIERAAVIKEILKFNSDLAARKYYLKTVWAVYYDERFATMQPITP